MGEYYLLEQKDGGRWHEEVEMLDGPRPDIHYGPEYASLFRTIGVPRLFVYREGRAAVVYPFLCRRVSTGGGPSDELYDITSPYGYGGPLASARATRTTWNNFYRCFAEYCRDNRIITEFIRFHPLLQNHRFMAGQVEVERASSVVVVDLRRSEEEIWSGYERNNRKNIKKACREGLTVVLEQSPGHVKEFIDIYHHTLSRNRASPFYYFPREFYDAIHREMAGNYIYAHTVKGDRIISTELLLFNATYVHSFLGGTLEEYYQLRPNNLLKHEVIKWAKARGIQYYLLGGGYRAGDGIFRYKRSFATGGVLDYYIGKKVHDPDAVRLLEERLAAGTPRENGRFFPGYRRY